MIEIRTPRLIKSTVLTCARCGAWWHRHPKYADQDGDDGCPRCGCTSYNWKEGRPYGPKSAAWPYVLEGFQELDKSLRELEPEFWEESSGAVW